MDAKEKISSIIRSTQDKIDSLDKRQKVVGDVSIGKILNLIRALPTCGVLGVAALTAWAGWNVYKNIPLWQLESKQNRAYDAVPVNADTVCGLVLPPSEEQENHPGLEKTLQKEYYGFAEKKDGEVVFVPGLRGEYPNLIRGNSTLNGNSWMALKELCDHRGKQKDCGALSDPDQWNPDTPYINTHMINMYIAPFDLQKNVFDPLHQITWPEDMPHGGVACGEFVNK